LGKEIRKPMDLAIPMGQNVIERKQWRSRGMKRNMPESKSFWNRFRNNMINMPIRHENMWSLKLGNTCG
jgi:hypothetical protein